MSSDSERLSKPIKRPRPIVSDSESSDDSFINTTHGKKRVGRLLSDRESSDDDSDFPIQSAQRRKAHKLVIEDESSYQSGSSSNEEGTRTNFEGGSTSSEWESDWESMDEEPAAAIAVAGSTCKNKCKKAHKSPDKKAPRISSDSENSDGESEKCPICLLSFRKQEVANPSSCEHCFCLDCLIEWSKNVNTCPVDRQTFTVINVRAKIGGKIIRHVPIDVKSPEQPVVQEDPTYCEICQRCDREDRLLLCDGCDSGYHLECLDPPMDEVPLEEHWYCPECSRNAQDDAEDVEIDLDEVPDLMEEARSLGLSYGRSRAFLTAQNLTPRRGTLLPRTRQAERVRANVRAGRSRQAAAVAAASSSREQPSTSSGFDSISENSRSRSPVPGTSGLSSAGSRRRKPATRVAKSRRKPKKKRTSRTTSRAVAAEEFREVRISEINEDGEREEFVTYVRARSDGPLPSGRRRKKRKKKTRRARTVASVAAAMKTAKRRLASQLKIMNKQGAVPGGVPLIKNESTPQHSNTKIRVARHSAGIGQVSLFGGGLGLDYSPPGSEDESEETTGLGGPGLLSRARPATSASSIRRRLALKGAAFAGPVLAPSTQSVDLLSSILDSQEIWHSRKTKVTLKSDGSLLVDKPRKEDANNNNSSNNSPIKSDKPAIGKEKPLDLTSVNPNDVSQQAPMYNNSRGGGNRGGGGGYQSGGNYRDNRRSHGGNYGGGGGGGGGGDSYSGRHSYGGSSNAPQDYSSSGGQNYSSGFQQPAPPSLLNMPSPFRGRNPQNFRNRFPPPPGFGPDERNNQGNRQGNNQGNNQANSQSNNRFQGFGSRGPPPPPPLALRMPNAHQNRSGAQKYQPEGADEDDMYGDLEAQRKPPEDDSGLLPPPDPPTDLLDFDESERGQDSDREDLVIDDAPREEAAGSGRHAHRSHSNADKYDPFAADSESDEEGAPKGREASSLHQPLRPPPGLSGFPGLKNDDNESIMGDNASIMGDNASIMGDNASIMGDNASVMGDDDFAPPSEKDRARSSGQGSRPLEPPPSIFGFPSLNVEESDAEESHKAGKNKDKNKKKVAVPRIRLTAYDDDEDSESDSDCPNFSIYSSETMDVARNTEKEVSSQIGSMQPKAHENVRPLAPPPMPSFGDEGEQAGMDPLEPPPFPPGMTEDDLQSKAGSPESVAPLEPPPVPMDEFEESNPLEPPPLPPGMTEDDLQSKAGSPPPLEPPPMPPMEDLDDAAPLEPPPMPPMDGLDEPAPLEPPPMPPMGDLDDAQPLEPPPIPPMGDFDDPPPLEPPPMPPLDALGPAPSPAPSPAPRILPIDTSIPPPTMMGGMGVLPPTVMGMPPPSMMPVMPMPPPVMTQPPLPVMAQPPTMMTMPPVIAPVQPLSPPPMPPMELAEETTPLEPPPMPPSILGDDEPPVHSSSDDDADGGDEEESEEEEGEGEEENAEEEPVIGPKNRGRTRKKSTSKTSAKKGGEEQEDEAAEAPQYLDAVQKERQALNKTSGKIQLDSRGKITFKIGNVSRLNKVNLYDELDEAEISRMSLDLEKAEREREKEEEKKERDKERDKHKERDKDREKDRDKHKEKDKDKRKDDKDKSKDKYDKDSKSKDSKSKDSKSKYDDKKNSSKSSKSSKDSKGKHRSSKDQKSSKDSIKYPIQSGWDIKPRGMTSSSSSSDSDVESIDVPPESPILVQDSPPRPAEVTETRPKSISKPPINIDLDELQQTLDKKLVELEDLTRMHPDESDMEIDHAETAEKDTTTSLIKLTEQENSLLAEIEKSCEVNLEEPVAESTEEREALQEEPDLDKSMDESMDMHISADEEMKGDVEKEVEEDVAVKEEFEKLQVKADAGADKDEDADADAGADTDSDADAEAAEAKAEAEAEAEREAGDEGLDAKKELPTDDTSVKSMEMGDSDEELHPTEEAMPAPIPTPISAAEAQAAELLEQPSLEADKSPEKSVEHEEEKADEAEEAAAGSEKSEVIDLDSAEFVEKPSSYDLEHDGLQIVESVDDELAAMASTTPARKSVPRTSVERASEWEREGAFTPCKDERPLRSKSMDRRMSRGAPYDSGLEPITPMKDRSISDGLDGCRTPAGYAGLGTEAISETDEAMNFEDELALLNMRSRDKDVEEGEIPEDRPRRIAAALKAKELALEEESRRKRKKDKRDKSKEAERNKENIASESNLAAAAAVAAGWKKAVKVVAKERQYREKRSKSKDPKSKKKKELLKKKEKRKELPRYDVRRLVAEKPRPRKDEYGRDIRDSSASRSLSLSRERSLSYTRRSRSYTPPRRRVSRSRSRSWSRGRRSRSYSSPSRRRSLSPRGRREKLRKRSLSRTRGRSRSRSRSRSRRRSLSPRVTRKSRRSMSRKRKSRSRSSSRSRSRRKERKKHVSRSRSRVRKRSRSKSQRKREKKHSKRKTSRSRSRSRSLEPRHWELAAADKVMERGFGREAAWQGHWTPSWSRSRSKTPPLVRTENIARNWSPPGGLSLLNSVGVPSKNLKVILTNKEAIKKKKKEKRKEVRKAKEVEKKRKGKKGRSPPPSKEVFASGDNILVSVCFNKDNESQPTTGLPELPETIPLLPPVKRRRREPLQLEPPSVAPAAKRAKKDKGKEKNLARAKSPAKPAKKKEKKKSKAAEIAATKKPMAVIDLDQSPFREQTPSPRDVIVLSDDDDKQAQPAEEMEEMEEMGTPEQQPESHTPARIDPQFLQGPKTPPEPQVKFSIANKPSNLRPSLINPLLEEEEEEEEEMLEEEMEMSMTERAEMEELMDERAEEELDLRAQEELESRVKVGPNTPPEPPSSPPTSPDAYDPFDPTKSRSPTPEPNSQEDNNADETLQAGGDSPLEPAEVDASEVQSQAEQQEGKSAPDKPKIISIMTIKRPSPASTTPPLGDAVDANGGSPPAATTAQTAQSSAQQSQPQAAQQSVPQLNPFPSINPVLATVAAAVQRSSIFSASGQLVGPRNLLQQQQQSLPRPTLPNIFGNSLPKTIPTRTLPLKVGSKNISMLGQNGSDANIEISNDNIDMSSPYSPGSTLSDGLFDPPSPAFNSSPNIALSTKIRNSQKKEVFDTLFNASPIVHKSSGKAKMNVKKMNEKDKRKKGTHSKIGVRMDENQLQILDDLPSSAVEMQVKDKFLKKLNRQERVVEEVKLVLKPHYTKKHVTKEEYKDIMRRAVPKICHNKTGEINPTKIAALIEAYVKKVRAKKKSFGGSSSTNAIKKPSKNLWS